MEEYKQLSLFENQISNSFDKADELQEELKEVFERKIDLFFSILKKEILYFDNEFPLYQRNYGSRFPNNRIYCGELDTDFKFYIENKEIKVRQVKNCDNFMYYNEGSSLASPDDIKLQVKIANKKEYIELIFHVNYDISEFEKDEDGNIFYCPKKLKITEKNIDEALKEVENKLENFLRGYDDENNIEYGDTNEKIIEGDNKQSGNVLQESTQEKPNATTNNSSSESENTRAHLDKETSKEMESNRLYEIAIDSSPSHCIQNIAMLKSSPAEDKLNNIKEEIFDYLINLKTEIEKISFQKNKDIYSSLTQNFREKDMASKLEAKIQRTIKENLILTKTEKEKILEDFSLGFATDSLKNISKESENFIGELVKEKLESSKDSSLENSMKLLEKIEQAKKETLESLNKRGSINNDNGRFRL